MLAYKTNILAFPRAAAIEVAHPDPPAEQVTTPVADTPVKVSLAEAPPEAWRQAMMPELQKAAAEHANPCSSMYRAIIVIMLMHLKQTARLGWLHKITGYGTSELGKFLYRARAAGLILKSGAVILKLEFDDELGKEIELVLQAGVLDGMFMRNAEGKWLLGDHFGE